MGKEIVPIERIAGAIHFLRGQRVMLDFDLAALYGVATKALNQSVKHNTARFSDDFMFRLANEEVSIFRSQTVTSSMQATGNQLSRMNWSRRVTSSSEIGPVSLRFLDE